MMADSDRELAEARLAAFGAELRREDIPPAVRHEARRSLVNIFATALAGSHEPAVDIALATLAPFSGAGTGSLVGRSERVDAPLAAFVNAMSANIFDFDDTHEATIIHPAAIVFAALFAQGEASPVSGASLLRAFVIGGEVECRIGNALTPWHYARGWHITSTCGVFGAAAGVGALLGLDRDRMLHAFAAAAVQSSGLVDALGTMAKSLGVGGAARNGLLAARLAEAGLLGPSAPLSGARGFLRVYGGEPRLGALTDGLGRDWEIAKNTYKPYPAGVVLTPLIDACLDLREREGLTFEDVAAVEVTAHPLLRERTDRPAVRTGREAQVSAQHAVAIVLKRGAAGLDEFSDAAAAETLRAGRPVIAFHDDSARDVASAEIVIDTRDGGRLRREVAAARGSRGNPLTDAELEAKLEKLARHVHFPGDPARLAHAIWAIEDLADASALVRLARSG
ncbi:MAG TPA: MmgE/PrpD family protein [Thermohalobaculum sp.]|nr:MmgE/PrpD family protein [Thermohalobaculum sp.]